jgi:hypothetical protein
VILILDADVEQHVRQLTKHSGEPRRHRIGIDRDRDPGPLGRSTARLRKRLGLQHHSLRGQSQEGDAGCRWTTGLFTNHQHLANSLLQRLDALADRGWRHMQPLGSGISLVNVHAPQHVSTMLALPGRHVQFDGP